MELNPLPNEPAVAQEKTPEYNINLMMPPKIYAALMEINAEITHISKTKKNAQQGFMFRGIDDYYNYLHPFFVKHGVIMTPEVLSTSYEERTTKSGTALIYCRMMVRYHFIAEDGSEVTCTAPGEGMDSGDKATNKAMSAAQKYALCQTFLIPVAETKDADSESPEESVSAKAIGGDTVFEPSFKEHRDALSGLLIKHGVPSEFFDGIALRLKGRQIKDAGVIYRELQKEKANGANQGQG